MQQLDSLGYYGSTGKFSNVILVHLFSHISFSPTPHSFGYASGLLPQSDEKIYANLRGYFISDSLNEFAYHVTNLYPDQNTFCPPP